MARRLLKFAAKDKATFDAIKDGRKTIETRAGTVAYQQVEAGDSLTLECGGERIEKIVQKVKQFASVEEAFNSPDFTKILPGVTTLAEAEKVYYGFPGYRERIAENGLLAFYLQ